MGGTELLWLENCGCEVVRGTVVGCELEGVLMEKLHMVSFILVDGELVLLTRFLVFFFTFQFWP